METAPTESYLTPHRIESVMGNEHKGLLQFFVNLFCSAIEMKKADMGFLIAFITRRCHVLCEIYYRFLLWDLQQRGDIYNTCFAPKGFDNPDELIELLADIYKNHFVTDTALKAMGEALVMEYCQNGTMRKLFIVDELLIHGRAVNRFLYDLECTMRQTFRRMAAISAEPAEHAAEFDDVFCERVRVIIYICNSERILLMPRYEKMIVSSRECEPQIWRAFSMRLARLISVSAVNNVAFSWSFCLSRAKTPSVALKAAGAFQHFTTAMCKTSVESFIWLYPNEDSPKALCSVRCKTVPFIDGDGTQKQLLVPHTIFDHLTWDASWRLHQTIVMDLRQEQVGEPLPALLTAYDERLKDNPENYDIYYRRIVEMNELFINSLIMRAFFAQAELTAQEQKNWIEQIDFWQLSHNFASIHLIGQDVCDALRQIWEIDEKGKLQRYMDILLEGVPVIPEDLRQFGTGHTVLNWDAEEQEHARQCVTHGVEDAIAEIGFRAERNAFLNYSSKASLGVETLSEWGEHESLGTVLQKCRSYLDTEYLNQGERYATLAQVGAILVHAMDYGFISMHPIIARPPKESNYEFFRQSERLYTELRAGEQSLFILPLRYQNLLDVLEHIAWHGDDYGNVVIDLKLFIRELQKKPEDCEKYLMEPHLEKMLLRFYEMIIGSGQRFQDWTFIGSVNAGSVLEQLRNEMKQLRYWRAYIEAL